MSNDPSEFDRKQSRLAEFWTFVCVTGKLRHENDWIRTELWGRSIFIQRIGGVLKGFENICAHRFFPLRTADSGNGPIRCGFHGWTYDGEGAATDIPICSDVFGRSAPELDRRLRRVDVATCGETVFARMPSAAHGESLDEYLGDLAPILRTLSVGINGVGFDEIAVQSPWHINYQVTLDDYHMVAVHPDSIGANGHVPPVLLRYDRRDPHSILIVDDGLTEKTFDQMVAACRDGTYRPTGYRTFNIFPNLLLAQSNPAVGRQFVILSDYRPRGPNESTVRTWCFPMPSRSTGLHRLRDVLLEPLLVPIVRYKTRKIYAEDRQVAERLHDVASHAAGRPLLGKREERIAWFNVAYNAAIGPSAG